MSTIYLAFFKFLLTRNRTADKLNRETSGETSRRLKRESIWKKGRGLKGYDLL
jgi:hypothetical protein